MFRKLVSLVKPSSQKDDLESIRKHLDQEYSNYRDQSDFDDGIVECVKDIHGECYFFIDHNVEIENCWEIIECGNKKVILFEEHRQKCILFWVGFYEKTNGQYDSIAVNTVGVHIDESMGNLERFDAVEKLASDALWEIIQDTTVPHFDTVDGHFGFMHKGVFITDPHSSSCGRFYVDAVSGYGLNEDQLCNFDYFYFNKEVIYPVTWVAN